MDNIFYELLRDAREILNLRAGKIYNDIRSLPEDTPPLTKGRLEGEEATLDFCLTILDSDYPDELYDRFPTFMKTIEAARKKGETNGKGQCNEHADDE